MGVCSIVDGITENPFLKIVSQPCTRTASEIAFLRLSCNCNTFT